MPPLDKYNSTRNLHSCLAKFHPVHYELIDQLMSQKVGLFNRSYRVRRFQSCGHNFPKDGKTHYDLFLLSVPVCADEYLEWQVILNEYEPHMRPDFKVFHPGFSQFLARNLARSGLFHYNTDRKDALFILVERLKKMYYEYVIYSLNHSSHVYHNISNTLDMLGAKIPYELHHLHNSVDIALPLDLDLSSVQLTPTPKDCSVILILTSPYPPEADIDYNTRLHANPELREQLSLDQFKVPKFNRDRPMLSFIRQLTARLQGHIIEASLVQEARKRYLLALISLCRSSVGVWDPIHFRTGTLCLSTRHPDSRLSFLVHLQLSDRVQAKTVSVYTGAVLTEFTARLTSDPRELLARIEKEVSTDRYPHSAVRGLMDSLKSFDRPSSPEDQ